jgi:hypothetical protein
VLQGGRHVRAGDESNFTQKRLVIKEKGAQLQWSHGVWSCRCSRVSCLRWVYD